jgi:ABC-type transport system involved in multi-copper enzyme maturation permease subunit
VDALWVVVVATLRESKRRRILFAAVVFGALVLVLFGTAFTLISRELVREGQSLIERRLIQSFFLLLGLYAVNVLTVMTAAFLPIDTLSGEIASGVLQPVAARPIRRATIVLGKWLGHYIVVACYLLAMLAGMLSIGWFVGGIVPLHLERAIPLMLLEALVFLTLSIAGGTRFSTIANGVCVFGLYGFAFLAGWVEQIATFAGSDVARDIGTAASLLVPTEGLWQLAAHSMSPPILRDVPMTPFSFSSVPNGTFVAWAAVYIAIVLSFAVRTFQKREL